MRLIAVARKDTMVYNANRLIVMCWHHDGVAMVSCELIWGPKETTSPFKPLLKNPLLDWTLRCSWPDKEISKFITPTPTPLDCTFVAMPHCEPDWVNIFWPFLLLHLPLCPFPKNCAQWLPLQVGSDWWFGCWQILSVASFRGRCVYWKLHQYHWCGFCKF